MFGSLKGHEPPPLKRYRTGDGRDWRTKSVQQNTRQIIEENYNQRKARNKVVAGISALCVVFLVLLAAILFLLEDRAEQSRLCVPGFVGENCEKSDFLGTFAWSTNEFYVLSDGLQHRKGIAFRVYAPRAQSVVLKLLPVAGVDHSYSMIKQENGYWFYNAGSVGSGCEYYYMVESETGSFTKHLIQGGKEVALTSRGWINVEPDDSKLAEFKHFVGNSVRDLSANILYVLHIPSFSNSTRGHGTFLSAIPHLRYLRELGVTIIRLMGWEPSICEGEEDIRVSCWYHSAIVYPGVPHPALGTQQELVQLIEAIHAEGMYVLVDIDWTSFSTRSDYYDYDGSSTPTAFGALFQTSEAGQDAQGKALHSIDLGLDRPGATLLNDVFYRYTWVFGLDGVYWKGLLCLRVDGVQCEDGVGIENLPNARYLREVVNRLSTVNLWFGEDDDNVNYVQHNAASIQNIVLDTTLRGAGFHAKRDLRISTQLKEMYLSESLRTTHLKEFLAKSATTTNIIQLQTPEEAYLHRLLSHLQQTHNTSFTSALHRMVQMNALIACTPGILAMLQGDEYAEPRPFGVEPPILDLMASIGKLTIEKEKKKMVMKDEKKHGGLRKENGYGERVDNHKNDKNHQEEGDDGDGDGDDDGDDTMVADRGEGYGMFIAMKTLIQLRKDWELHKDRQFSFFWESEQEQVLVMTVNGDESKLFIFSTWDSEEQGL